MKWLSSIADAATARKPSGEIIVSSGVSPSGKYHLGTLREVLTAEAVTRELKKRGRKARHIHVVDDLDVFRKVPANVPAEFERYLGMPLCDVPSPDGSDRSYAEYFLADLLKASEDLHLEMEVVVAHKKYRAGFFVPAIEKTLQKSGRIRQILEKISGHKLSDTWSPIQVNEDGYLKNRQITSVDEQKKEITYVDKSGDQQKTSYSHGEVKLNWRIDWAARWWLMGVDVEPFGRDHAARGGSYDTGEVIAREVFEASPPIPVPYNFINKTGDTKKMSKSAGGTITAAQLLTMLPPEIVWFFVLRYPPNKLLSFDEGPTLMRLFDEFSELLSKKQKTSQEEQLLELCMYKVDKRTVTNIPFSHLVSSYQASLRDTDKTIEVLKRSEYAQTAMKEADVIRAELRFIEAWLESGAPEDVKFSLIGEVDEASFSDSQKSFFAKLAEKVANAPEGADGEWFHNAIYELKNDTGLQPKHLFASLYQLLIGKDSGPRGGWFLSILPREWLLKRLKFKE